MSAAALALGPAAAQQWRPPSQRPTAPSLNQPPAPRREARPAPRPGYVFVPGHWRWSSRQRRYVWEQGDWVRDRPGLRFVGPRWVLRRGEWSFVPGHWVR
ncbi:hypothetical protein [Xanthobacter sp. KR7-225]|uniref:hypothetical protein n=1 Tax=Xanthobacter sp. KR7-225 TaxID=3156613 RepID=UPI0032B59C39